jgi:hypothetical protein
MNRFTKNMLRQGVVATLLVGTIISAQTASAQGRQPPAAPDTTFKPGMNLITNASHEGPGVFFDGRGELYVSWNWVPFWTEPPPGTNLRDQRYRTPEFRMADGSIEVFKDRVKSGRLSNHGFNYFAANPAAGFMQNVKNLKPGSPIRFTSWVLLWTSNIPNLIPPKSVEPGNLEGRVCIDQDGGPRDMTDPNLVCSDWSKKYDEWHQLSVDGVAKADTVNAFLWTRSSEFVEHNDYYMDDSCFEVLAKATDKGICKGAGFVNDGRLEVLDWYQRNTN